MSFSAYQPAHQVLEHIKNTDFVAVVGPTAVGKSTLIMRAAQREARLHPLVGTTTRPPRPGEQDGVDMHFQTKEVMEARAGKGGYVTLVIGATGDLYGTAPEDYPAGKVTVLPVLSYVVAAFRTLPFRTFRTIFIVPPSFRVWHERLERRGFSPAELAHRMREAETSLEFALADQAAQLVVNDGLATAAADFLTLALGEPLPPHLVADQALGREIAGQLLAELRRVPARNS